MADTPGTQDAPIEDGANEATRAEQIRGILDQVREDVRLGHAHDQSELLRQRLSEAGIAVSEDELEAGVVLGQAATPMVTDLDAGDDLVGQCFEQLHGASSFR